MKFRAFCPLLLLKFVHDKANLMDVFMYIIMLYVAVFATILGS